MKPDRSLLRFAIATPLFMCALVLVGLLAPASKELALAIALAALYVIVVTV